MEQSLIERLRIRANIRRGISTRKSVQEGKPDKIADLLEEAADYIEQLEYYANVSYKQIKGEEMIELKYPVSKTSIDDMCEIIKFFDIESTEYTDCTILYEVTFDQLRTIYNLGKDHAAKEKE